VPKKTGPLSNPYMSVAEAAEKLGISQQWVMKLCRDGALSGAYKLSGKETSPWLIPAVSVEAYAAAAEKKTLKDKLAQA